LLPIGRRTLVPRVVYVGVKHVKIMYVRKLIKVQDHFQLSGVGLTVHPDFSVPENGKWIDFTSKAKVITTDGKESFYKVHVGTWHFNISDPKVDIDKRWRVVLSFPDGDKEQIPIGSEIFVSKEDYNSITGANA
jgi:hypothetical protein